MDMDGLITDYVLEVCLGLGVYFIGGIVLVSNLYYGRFALQQRGL